MIIKFLTFILMKLNVVSCFTQEFAFFVKYVKLHAEIAQNEHGHMLTIQHAGIPAEYWLKFYQ